MLALFYAYTDIFVNSIKYTFCSRQFNASGILFQSFVCTDVFPDKLYRTVFIYLCSKEYLEFFFINARQFLQ